MISVEPMNSVRAEELPPAFAALGWPGKGADLYRRYLAEQDDGTRVALSHRSARGWPAAALPTGLLRFPPARRYGWTTT